MLGRTFSSIGILGFGFNANRKTRNNPSIRKRKSHTLCIIEFDDQGAYFDIEQFRELRDTLEKYREKDLRILVFIHGWRHNAHSEDANLVSFESMLSDAHKGEVAHGEPRHVLGVYLSWRGSSLPGNIAWEGMSFWGRKSAAARVAAGSVREVLGLLRKHQIQVNSASSDLQTDRWQKGTRLVFMGHSFGAQILFYAVAEHLIESITSDENVYAYGDLVILVNPAFEASKYTPIYTAIKNRVQEKFVKNQRVCFVSITAKNDLATRLFFRIGRYPISLIQSARKNALEFLDLPPGTQKDSIRMTMGHLPWLTTHEITAPSDAKLSAKESKRRTRQSHEAYRGSHPNTVDADEAADFSKFNATFRSDGHLAKGWVRTYTGGATLRHTGSENKLKHAGTEDRYGDPDNPFWVVSASKEVIDNHGGIFGDVFLDFIRQLTDDRLRPIATPVDPATLR